MTRYRAAGLHLLISVAVVGAITLAIYLLWFPYGLIRIAGMDRLLVTMLCVDIVAGPLLTCVVFKAGDPCTPHDLTVIGVLQAAFMAYALHTAWISRPVFLVWSVDRAYLVFANEIEPKHLADGAMPQTRALPWAGPREYAIVLPKEHEPRAAVFVDLIKKQTSLERLPLRYRPYRDARDAILKQSRPAAAFKGESAERERAVRDAVTATGRPAQTLRVVAIESSRDASLLLVDAASAAPVRAVSPPPLTEDAAAGRSEGID